MELDFDKLFNIPTIALKIGRVHPFIEKDKKWFLQTAVIYGIYSSVFCLIVYNIFCYDLKINNFYQTCKNAVLCIVYLVVAFQYWVLIRHEKSLRQLIYYVKRDYLLTGNLTHTEQCIVEKYVKQGVYVCKQWLVVSIMGSGLFLFKNITLMAYFYWIDEFRLVQFYELVYPGIIEEYKENIIVFILIYSYLLYYALYASVMYSAYVPIGPIMMLHACGQLEIVKLQINRLFIELDDEVIRQKLKGIIKRLQYIYSFVDIINYVFQIAYELTMKATTIVLPITFYELIEATNRGELSLEFLTFIVGGLLISSSPCYYSDLLMDKGEEVRLALYTCGWELHYNRGTRTTIQIMLLYALRPIAIRTVFRTLCLEALTELFQQSYTIFNLMNAVWE